MKLTFTLLLLVALSTSFGQTVLTQFNFNKGSNQNVASGTMLPTTGAGSLKLIGGVKKNYNAGYPGSANDNSGLYTYNFPPQRQNEGTAGIEVAASTADKSNITISWWQYHQSQSSKYLRFEYSVDGGSTWQVPDLASVNTSGTTGIINTSHNVFGSSKNNTWYFRSLDLSSITDINNNPDFHFRIVSVFAPDSTRYVAAIGKYDSVGTWRFDDVTITENSPLPVQLGSFTASLKNGIAELNWQTFTEINFKQFEVEESADATAFNQIGVVASKQQANGASYTFSATPKTTPITYYRLKMVDNDGKFSYSRIVSVNRNLTLSFSAFPNPTTDYLLITHNKAAANTTINIVSIDGKVIATYPVQQDAYQTSINVSTLTKGMYLVVYANSNGKQVLKIMKN